MTESMTMRADKNMKLSCLMPILLTALKAPCGVFLNISSAMEQCFDEWVYVSCIWM